MRQRVKAPIHIARAKRTLRAAVHDRPSAWYSMSKIFYNCTLINYGCALV